MPIRLPSTKAPTTKLFAELEPRRAAASSTLVARCSAADAPNASGSVSRASRRRCQNAVASAAVRMRMSTGCYPTFYRGQRGGRAHGGRNHRGAQSAALERYSTISPFYSRIFALEAAVPVSPIVFASQRRVPAARDARWTDSACRGGESGPG